MCIISLLQFITNGDEAANWMVQCTKLYPKMHVFHFGHLFYALFAHHPDTARPFFGPGIVHCEFVESDFCILCVEPKLDVFYYPLMPWLGTYSHSDIVEVEMPYVYVVLIKCNLVG